MIAQDSENSILSWINTVAVDDILGIDTKKFGNDRFYRISDKLLRNSAHIIHHSDRGSQYASHEYQRTLKNYGIIPSMSRKRNCLDNAVGERFFRSLKSERVNLNEYSTRKHAVIDVLDYIVSNQRIISLKEGMDLYL